MRTKHFKDRKDLEKVLYSDITTNIELSIREFGKAHILLSGGSTPKALYAKMADAPIDWSKVIIGLVDDRNVPITSEHSNERMLRETFSSYAKGGPQIIGMVGHKLRESDIEERYLDFFERIDYTLLGMGTDGHTASLFPNDIPSEASLRNSQKEILFTKAPSFPNDRITCSRGLIISSKNIGLMICGEEKLTILESAEERKLPIGFFTNVCTHLTTYYSKS